jgi:hypothetical protein
LEVCQGEAAVSAQALAAVFEQLTNVSSTVDFLPERMGTCVREATLNLTGTHAVLDRTWSFSCNLAGAISGMGEPGLPLTTRVPTMSNSGASDAVLSR